MTEPGWKDRPLEGPKIRLSVDWGKYGIIESETVVSHHAFTETDHRRLGMQMVLERMVADVIQRVESTWFPPEHPEALENIAALVEILKEANRTGGEEDGHGG